MSLSACNPDRGPEYTTPAEFGDSDAAEVGDSVVAIGGGSVIDSAKAIAAGVPYDGDFWDFFCGKAKPAKTTPFGVVLTMAAAGSESSNSSADGTVPTTTRTLSSR